MPDVKFSNLYPYTDFHELNLDWVISQVKYWSERVGKSIQTIEKTGTAGLVDTYTITYSDGTTSTFDVTNGNGIASVTKTGTAGLVDTYTITFQDGSTTTFDVTNGAAAVDPTLTLPDYAADAAAVGQRFVDNSIPLRNLNVSGYFDTDTWQTLFGNIAKVGDDLLYTVVTPSTNACLRKIGKIPGYISGHKYYVYFRIETTSATTGRIYLGNAYTLYVGIPANTATIVSGVYTPAANNELGVYFDTSNMSVGDVVKLYDVAVVDLTDTYALQDLDLIDIDSIVSSKTDEWDTTGFASMNVDFIKRSHDTLRENGRIIVAAANSDQKLIANYVCTGINDQEKINAAINDLPADGGTIELLDGTYILNMPIYPKQYTRIAGKGKGTILKVADEIKAYLTGNAVAGYNNFTCDITGFQVGMDITIFSDVHTGYGNGESKVITAINPNTNTITVDSNFTQSYLVSDNAVIFSAYNAIDCYTVTDVTIENIALDGNKANQSVGNYDEWQNGVYLNDSHNSVVRNCYIYDFPMCGICTSHKLTGSKNIDIHDNYISGCRYNAFHAHGMQESNVSDNIVDNGEESVIYLINSDDNNVTGNIVLSGEYYGILILASVRVNLSGNVIKNTSHAGIVIASAGGINCKDISIINNRLYAIGNTGIKVSSTEAAVIAGNNIDTTVEYGIAVNTSTYCQIVNNTLTAISGANGIIDYANGSYDVISGNTVKKTSWGAAIYVTSNYCVIISNICTGRTITVSGTGCVTEHNIAP